MFSSGLATPAILGPQLQFTLRGFVAGMIKNEALPFKPLIILALILALWTCAYTVVTTAGYTTSSILVSKAYHWQPSDCFMGTGGGQLALGHQSFAVK